MIGSLYIVATPIGNLEDLSLRALRILKEVDLILCEDTRTTRKLLSHYDIHTPVLSYHQHSRLQKIEYIADQLKQGKNLALVSEAGTPSISDPGCKLVGKLVSLQVDREENFETYKLKNLQTKIIPIPGPSALVASASISGFPMDRFLFLGFLPRKKKRKKFLEIIKNSKFPIIFYESPYRIIKTLEELQDILKDREVVVCRELTKKFESVYRGSIPEVLRELKADKIKGEFVVIVNHL